MRLGVDIDNVIADFESAFRSKLNATCGLRLAREDITTFRFCDCTPLSQAEVMELFWEFVAEGGLRNLEPIPRAAECLRYLANHHQLHLVTSRPAKPTVVSDTVLWLSQQKIPYHRLLWAEQKASLQAAFDTFIEDSLEQALGLASRGIRVFLIDYPWNRNGAAHPSIERVASWPEITRLLSAPGTTQPDA